MHGSMVQRRGSRPHPCCHEREVRDTVHLPTQRWVAVPPCYSNPNHHHPTAIIVDFSPPSSLVKPASSPPPHPGLALQLMALSSPPSPPSPSHLPRPISNISTTSLSSGSDSPSPSSSSSSSSLQHAFSPASLEESTASLRPPSSFPAAAASVEVDRQSTNTSKHRQSAPSTSAIASKQTRPGLFTLAALARDKTTNAIANFAEPTIPIRPRPSTALYRSAPDSPSSSSNPLPRSPDSQTSNREVYDPARSSSSNPSVSPSSHSKPDPQHSASNQRQSLLETNPPSQAYSNTAADTPAPISVPFVPGSYNKMHQTSSRLLRMTSDDRPFTRVSISARLTRH